MSPEDRQFGYVIQDVGRLLKRRFDAEAQRHDLTLPQWRVISQLAGVEGISQATLAARLDTDPVTVSGMVERLEAKGFVVRIADPSDSRAKIVRLTDTARTQVGEMGRRAEEVFGQALAGLSAPYRSALLRVLTRMSANLSKGAAGSLRH